MSLKKQFNKERAEILNLVPNRKDIEKIILSKLKANMVKNKKKYFTFDDLLKINEVKKYFNLIYATGDRNIGKTYDMRERMKRRFVENGSSSIWMRRLSKDVDKLLATEMWADDYKLIKKEKMVRYYDPLETDKQKPGVPVITFLDLNTIDGTKSIEFPTTNLIYFDEPNTEGTQIKNAYHKLSHLISTIQREKKDFLVILTSNYVKQDDNILSHLGLGQKKTDIQPLLIFNWIVGSILWNIPKDWYRKMSLKEKLNNLGYRSSLANFSIYRPQYGAAFNNDIENHIVNYDDIEILTNECVIITPAKYIIHRVNLIGQGDKILIDICDLEDDELEKITHFSWNEESYLRYPNTEIFNYQYKLKLRQALENFNLVFLSVETMMNWLRFLSLTPENNLVEEAIWETPILE